MIEITKNATNIQAMTDELHHAFHLINKKFFNEQIPLPAITIQSNGNRKLSMGWCTTKEIWGDKKGKQKMYEINLSAEYIDVSFFETMDTLMHEMVHLYNILKNVQDTSRNNTYHNKRFLNQALLSGFEYPDDKPDKQYGYSGVKLSQVTKHILNNMPIDQTVFSIGRKGALYFKQLDHGTGETIKERAKTNSYRWVCPSCSLIIRSTIEVIRLNCVDCNERLVYKK